MKLEQMILVIESNDDKEINFLMSLGDYIKHCIEVLDSIDDVANAVEAVLETKSMDIFGTWTHINCYDGHSIDARFCLDENMLIAFLKGVNNLSELGKWKFDRSRCSNGCLEIADMTLDPNEDLYPKA